MRLMQLRMDFSICLSKTDATGEGERFRGKSDKRVSKAEGRRSPRTSPVWTNPIPLRFSDSKCAPWAMWLPLHENVSMQIINVPIGISCVVKISEKRSVIVITTCIEWLAAFAQILQNAIIEFAQIFYNFGQSRTIIDHTRFSDHLSFFFVFSKTSSLEFASISDTWNVHFQHNALFISHQESLLWETTWAWNFRIEPSSANVATRDCFCIPSSNKPPPKNSIDNSSQWWNQDMFERGNLYDCGQLVEIRPRDVASGHGRWSRIRVLENLPRIPSAMPNAADPNPTMFESRLAQHTSQQRTAALI